MGEWPWQAIAAVATLLLTHFIKPLFGLFHGTTERELKIHERGWQRASELEEEITLLRKALHRQLLDRNSYSTALEVVTLAMDQTLDKRIEAVRQARAILENNLSRGGAAWSSE